MLQPATACASPCPHSTHTRETVTQLLHPTAPPNCSTLHLHLHLHTPPPPPPPPPPNCSTIKVCEEVLLHDPASEVWTRNGGAPPLNRHVLFRGPRIKIGVDVGKVRFLGSL
jgi:hypothetical protein